MNETYQGITSRWRKENEKTRLLRVKRLMRYERTIRILQWVIVVALIWGFIYWALI